MTTFKRDRWLLVAIAIVGFAVALPVVSAHGTDTTSGDAPTTSDAPTANETADGWATWMDNHTTEHMGLGSVEWMDPHAGESVDEMAQQMAEGNRTIGDDDRGRDDHERRAGHGAHGGMGGQGHC